MRQPGVLLFLAAAALLASCRSVSPAGAPPPSDVDPGRGTVAAKLIADPKAPTVDVASDEQYVQPQIMPGNPIPEYPQELVERHLPPQTIVVRFVANEKSKVESVTESPLGGTTDGPYCPRFEQSVREALLKWTVYPARIRKFRPGPDSDNDGKPDYRIMTSEVTLKSFFDISFVFEVIDGKAVVTSEARH